MSLQWKDSSGRKTVNFDPGRAAPKQDSPQGTGYGEQPSWRQADWQPLPGQTPFHYPDAAPPWQSHRWPQPLPGKGTVSYAPPAQPQWGPLWNPYGQPTPQWNSNPFGGQQGWPDWQQLAPYMQLPFSPQ